MNKLNRNQEKNAIIQHAVDESILQEINKVSAEDELHDNMYYEFRKDYLYEIDNTSLDKKTEKIE